MTDLMTHDEFVEKSDEEKRDLLNTWRREYTNNEIIASLGYKVSDYYQLMKELGVEKKTSYTKRVPSSERQTLSDEELETLKEDMPSFEVFRHITREQQSLLLDIYIERHKSIIKLAEAWGVDPSRIYTLRSINGSKRIKEKHSLRTLDFENPSDRLLLPDGFPQDIESSPIGTTYRLRGTFPSDELRIHLHALSGRLIDGDVRYRIDLLVEDVPTDPPKGLLNLSVLPEDPNERRKVVLEMVDVLLKSIE